MQDQIVFVKAAPAAQFIGDYPSSRSWQGPGTQHPARCSARGNSASLCLYLSSTNSALWVTCWSSHLVTAMVKLWLEMGVLIPAHCWQILRKELF